MLSLLRLAGNMHTPPQVITELMYHMPNWRTPEWISVSILSGSHVKEAIRWQQAGLIDAGEAEAIALAQQLKADWLLTDDTAARLFATELGLEVHGSLGVVLWSAAVGHLDRAGAEDALARLAQSSLWISARVLNEARLALDKMWE